MAIYTDFFKENKIIKEEIEKFYSLKIIKISKIKNGILNSNFLVEAENKNKIIKKYILRIFEADRTFEEEEQELKFLYKISNFVPVSLPLKNNLGKYISEIGGDCVSLSPSLVGATPPKPYKIISVYNSFKYNQRTTMGQIFFLSSHINTKNSVRRRHRISLASRALAHNSKLKKVSLFEYIDGEVLTETNEKYLQQIGKYLGKIHNFSKNIKKENFNRKSRIDFDFYLEKIKERETAFALLTVSPLCEAWGYAPNPKQTKNKTKVSLDRKKRENRVRSVMLEATPQNPTMKKYQNHLAVREGFEPSVPPDKKKKILDKDIERILKLAEEIKKINFENLPSGIIHSDIFQDNIIVKNNKIVAIIDFNEAYYAPFIYDIAIIISFWIRNKNFNKKREEELIKIFLDSYSKYRKIENEERELLDLASKKMVLLFILLRFYKENIEKIYYKNEDVEEKTYKSLINLL